MGRHKKREGKTTDQDVSGPWAGIYRELDRLARACNLFVLFDGEPAAPRLTLFETTRGGALLDYRPDSRTWVHASRPGLGGRCGEHAGACPQHLLKHRQLGATEPLADCGGGAEFQIDRGEEHGPCANRARTQPGAGSLFTRRQQTLRRGVQSRVLAGRHGGFRFFPSRPHRGGRGRRSRGKGHAQHLRADPGA